MATPIEHSFDTAEAAADDLAQTVFMRLTAAIALRGVALLAVSGGRSPVAVFDALSRRDLAWDQVTVAQVDERWVPADHPDSNSRLIREHLLVGPAAAARFLPMASAAPDLHAGQSAYEATLAALPGPFDVVLLGMGEDGHTASLFPGAPELHAGLTTSALCLAVTPPAAPHPRLSLSLAAITQSRAAFLQIGGAAKADVYRQALAPGPVETLPIRAVLRSGVPIEVWISD